MLKGIFLMTLEHAININKKIKGSQFNSICSRYNIFQEIYSDVQKKSNCFYLLVFLKLDLTSLLKPLVLDVKHLNLRPECIILAIAGSSVFSQLFISKLKLQQDFYPLFFFLGSHPDLEDFMEFWFWKKHQFHSLFKADICKDLTCLQWALVTGLGMHNKMSASALCALFYDPGSFSDIL
jgi:hypothetical protein